MEVYYILIITLEWLDNGLFFNKHQNERLALNIKEK